VLLHYLAKRGNTKIAFFTQMPEFNQSVLDFVNLLDSRLILTLLYGSLNLVIHAFSSELLWGHSSGDRKSREPLQLDCVARIMHQCTVFWFPLSQVNAEGLDR